MRPRHKAVNAGRSRALTLAGFPFRASLDLPLPEPALRDVVASSSVELNGFVLA